MKKHLVLLLLTVVTSCAGHSRSRNTVYGCEGAKVDLSCEHGKVINIIRANYGRISSNICSENGQNSDNWSTRCIQPTTLRHVTSACGQDVSSCSIHVTSSLFGDACPNTPKYLELVYTCQDKSEVIETPSLPDWILKIKALPEFVPESPSSSTTTTTTQNPTPAVSTQASSNSKFKLVTERFNNFHQYSNYQRNIPESLPLMNEELHKRYFEDKIIVNQPKNPKVEEGNILEDKRILPAIIVTAICIFIIGVIGVYMLLHKSDNDGTASDVYTIVKLDNCQYENFVKSNQGKIYQTPSNKYISSRSLNQSENYYQIV